MYQFLEHNSLYVVLVVVLLVWAGIFGYLFRLDRQVRKLERQ